MADGRPVLSTAQGLDWKSILDAWKLRGRHLQPTAVVSRPWACQTAEHLLDIERKKHTYARFRR